MPERLPAPQRPGPRIVRDLRPGLALLGALYTGLAAAETPEVVLIGPRYWATPPAFLAPLLTGGSRASDIVYALERGHPEPACAIYGHRCLPAIQEALLSGEFRMTGWWGQVRTSSVDLPGFKAGRVDAPQGPQRRSPLPQPPVDHREDLGRRVLREGVVEVPVSMLDAPV
ncbi:MAG: hypothetical protein EXR69_04320 [Myxococcales bacterium]|nr:hypothetical protein [Myxococcales bacterium]